MNKNLIWLLIAIIIFVIIFFISIPIDKIYLYILVIMFGFVIPIYIFFHPMNEQNVAFLHIVNALEIVENPHSSSTNINDAYNNIIKAAESMDSIESLKASYSSWHKEVNDIEKQFIKNLRNYVAPAIKDNKMDPLLLEKITLVFVEPSIEDLNDINKLIETELTEKEYSGGDFLLRTKDYILNTLWSRVEIKCFFVFPITYGLVHIFAVILGETPLVFLKDNFASYFAFCGVMIAAIWTRYR